SNSNCFIWCDRNTVFPSLFIFWWCFSITGNYFELSPMNMEWVYHSTHHIWFVINFPYFGNSFFLSEINSFWIKFLSVYCHHIHHSKQLNFFCHRQVLFFFCNRKIIHLDRNIRFFTCPIRYLERQ